MNLEHVASMGPGFFCTLLSVQARKHSLIVSQGGTEKHREQSYFRRNTDTVHKRKDRKIASCLSLSRRGDRFDRMTDLDYDGDENKQQTNISRTTSVL